MSILNTELAKEFKSVREAIYKAIKSNSDYTERERATVEQQLTDVEISQIEDEQMLTDHDIAILELQSREG